MPYLIDKFLDNAIEMDVDALCDGNDVVGGIMQHIEPRAFIQETQLAPYPATLLA